VQTLVHWVAAIAAWVQLLQLLPSMTMAFVSAQDHSQRAEVFRQKAPRPVCSTLLDASARSLLAVMRLGTVENQIQQIRAMVQ
jgi:hypothetical protein